MMRIGRLLAASLVLGVVLFGCDNDTTATRSAATGPGEALPAGLVLVAAPAGARDVAAVRGVAKAGDEVVVRGRVGGSRTPVVDGRATFQLVDASLKACGEGTAMDECKTPWDYCCSEPKEIAAHSATVQVVGPDGRPLRAALSGVGGLKPLSEVTVKGTVAKAADSGSLVVNASGIYIKG